MGRGQDLAERIVKKGRDQIEEEIGGGRERERQGQGSVKDRKEGKETVRERLRERTGI